MSVGIQSRARKYKTAQMAKLQRRAELARALLKL